MKRFLIIIAILLLAGAGYFTYEKWVKHADITKWSFVPADATMVLEMELMNDYDEISGYPIWNTLKETKGFSQIEENLAFLDSINGQGGFQAIFKEVPVLIATHNIASDDLDFLFVVDIQNISQNTFVGAAIGRLKKKGFRFKTRNYNGYKISEISKDGRIFTCIFFKNFLLASFTPYLVEDAIRTIEGGQTSFRERFKSIQTQQSSGLFNSYINYKKTSDLLSGVTKKKVSLPMNHGTYSVSLDSNFIDISGFTYANEGWLSTHKEQPGTFNMVEVIPENTAFVYHISSANITAWKSRQMNFIRNEEPPIAKLQDSLKSTFDFDVGQVLDLIDQEVGVLEIEPSTSREGRRMCIFEVKDTGESLKFFNRLAERIARYRGDSIYAESYSENEIRYLPIKDFPSLLLGNMAGRFDECFYINYRNYLILSNNLQELKSLISTIKDENTWGKSLRMNFFLQRANNAANVSLFVNIPRASSLLLNEVKNTWNSYLMDDISAYKSFGLAAFQFSYIDGKYFTNYTLSQPEGPRKSTPKTNPESGIRFANPIISKPFIVKTHVYKDFDILLQDSSNAIYYLDRNQNALWSQDIESKIVSEVFPLDYYKNGKIQYAFATSSEIHIWDRSGQSIPGYPKKLADEVRIDHFQVIDYDLSRNYRFAVSNSDGDVYLTDKDLKILEGWTPKKLGRSSLIPLTHQRIGRRDIMLSIQSDGKIHLMNRRGEAMPGFPFETQQSLDDSYFLATSNGLQNSKIAVLSRSGELTEVNLEGAVFRRDQLIKTTPETTFSIVPDRGKKSFLIVRKEGNSYQILDDTGNLLFQKDYLSVQPILIQYYQFGAGKDFVIFTDTANETLYIYDKSGNLITGNPLNSSHEVAILYSSVSKAFQVFTTWGSNLEVYSFKY